MVTLAGFLTARRRAAGCTQRAFATQLGIPVVTLSRLERGEPAKIKTVARLLAQLGTDVQPYIGRWRRPQAARYPADKQHTLLARWAYGELQRRGMTVPDLERAAGLGKGTLYALFTANRSNQYPPRGGTLAKIEAVLDPIPADVRASCAPDQWAASFRGMMVTARCAHCRRQFEHERRHPQLLCSSDCAKRYQATKLPPHRHPFHQFLVRQWTNSGQSFAGYARTIGIHRQTLRDLLDGGRPLASTYQQLQAHYGAALPAIETESQVRVDRARELNTRLGWTAHLHTKEANAKRRRTLRGQKRSPETRAKISAIVQARSQGEIGRRHITAWNKTDRAKIIRWITRTPASQLTRARLEAKAADVAARFPGFTPRAVTEIWRPYLERRGVVVPATVGRPPDSKRCSDNQRLRQRWNDGAKSAGGSYHDWAAPRLTTEANTLKVWERRHYTERLPCHTDAPLTALPRAVAKGTK